MKNVKKKTAPDGVDFYFPDREHLDGFVSSVLEGHEYPVLYWKLVDVKVVVDIGAHVGAALRHFVKLFPNAKYFAYEPNPRAFELLKRNTEHINAKNLWLNRCALGAFDEEMKLYMGMHSSMQASLLPNEENVDDGVVIPVKEAGSEIDKTCGGNIDLLKLDTEGMELPILRSLDARLKQVKYLFVEYHSDSDRVELEKMMLKSHSLYCASVFEPHRGTLCYISRGELERSRLEGKIKNYAFPKPRYEEIV